jgi:hypothetical protein
VWGFETCQVAVAFSLGEGKGGEWERWEAGGGMGEMGNRAFSLGEGKGGECERWGAGRGMGEMGNRDRDGGDEERQRQGRLIRRREARA